MAPEAIGLQPGDLILTTPYTFAATAEVIRYFNAVPVFVDVEPDTLNIDPAQVAQAAHDLAQGGKAAQRWLPPSLRCPDYTPISRAKLAVDNSPFIIHPLTAILPVHFAGLPADLDTIYSVAARHRLAVVEDAAHAFPARYKDHLIGQDLNSLTPPSEGVKPSRGTQYEASNCSSNGKTAAQSSRFTLQYATSPGAASRLTCFSFYATKTITTGEGGMITTGSPELAERCRIMALHGISKDAWKRYTAEGSWYYEIVAPGYKYNMTDIAAAMGVAQLAKAERMWLRRREIAQRYDQAFGGLPELQLPADRADCQHAWHLYVLRLNLDRLAVSRDRFIQDLKERNIGTSVHFIPLHLHPYYRDTYGYSPADFPVAFNEFQRVISLPIYSRMSDGDVEDVIRAVADLVNQHRQRIFTPGRVQFLTH